MASFVGSRGSVPEKYGIVRTLGHLDSERQRVKPCSWVGVKPDRQPDRSLLLQTSMVVSLVGSRVGSVVCFWALRAKFRCASFRCLVFR